MSSLDLQALSKRFGQFSAVADVSLRVEQGEFVALLGPSGCGKTTILRMIAGLIEPDGGRIRLGERNITHTAVHKRGIGLVFQSYALFPHLTVFENVAFGLRRRRLVESEIRQRVMAALGLVKLADLAERLPGQLSGGQQQRVALARAIAPEPPLLLLDEPLSNLDAKLREEMQVELKRIQRELGVTTVFVTHDQAEALSLSDRVCVLDGGRLQQIGTPEQIYFQPVNSFVARFLGRSNSFTGRIGDNSTQSTTIQLDNGWQLSAATELAADTPVEVILRQQSIRIHADSAENKNNALPGRVNLRAFAGASTHYIVELDAGGELLVEIPMSGTSHLAEVGDAVSVSWPTDTVIVLPRGNLTTSKC